MRKIVLATMVFVFAAVAVSPAWADRGHDRFGGHQRHARHDRPHWGVGLGLLAGTALVLAATQPRPVLYSSPPVMPPVVYTPPPAPQAYAEPAWWYYCNYPAGYYPYVNACPSGWMRVSPTPLGQ